MRNITHKMTQPKKLTLILFLLIMIGISLTVTPWLAVEAAPSVQSGPTPTPLVFDDVEFPHGEISFADNIISFKSGRGVEAPYDVPANALGLPDSDPVALGNSETTCESELVMEFVDNILLDVPGDDLWIFEIGPSVEAIDVYISPDDQNWISVGVVEGSTRGIDIADYTTPDQRFKFVKLCDHPDGTSSPAPYGGPDLDAVGAIGTEFQPIPDETAFSATEMPQIAGLSVLWWGLCFSLIIALLIGGVVLFLVLRRRVRSH